MATGAPSTGQTYSYSQLRKLWIQSGGNKGWSYVMAAVAMAESGGNPYAHHVDANGSIDYGLWQINSIHGYDPNKLYDPTYNAHAAVSVFNSSGPDAWSTYKSGAYKAYLSGGKGTPNIADPVPGGKYVRTDQGVDYVAAKNVRALVSGRITDIVPFAPGEGVASHTAIMEKFDSPVNYGGRLYYGGYYAEEKPLVKKGQHVQAGQDVMAAGSDEIGYLINKGTTFPPLIGGLGAGTQPSPAGKDYAGTVAKVGGPKPPGTDWVGTVLTIGGDVANPVGAVLGGAGSVASDIGSGISGAISGAFSGIESLILQGFFILIGITLVIVGLGLVAWTVMGKVGAPGVVGMAQTQMRIRQSGARTQESQRASMVRESQAGERIAAQERARELSARRLSLQERNYERRGERYVVKDKPNQVVRKKPGKSVSGVPRRS